MKEVHEYLSLGGWDQFSLETSLDRTSSALPLLVNSNAKSSLETRTGNMFYGTEGMYHSLVACSDGKVCIVTGKNLLALNPIPQKPLPGFRGLVKALWKSVEALYSGYEGGRISGTRSSRTVVQIQCKDRKNRNTGECCAARGIGEAIALKLAQEGADVVVADVDLEGAQQVVREIEGLGRKAKAI